MHKRDEEMKRQIIEQECIPWDEASERLELSANSLRVLAKRYLRRDLEGNIIESPAQMFRRVAYHIALADKEWGGDVEATTEKFYEMLTNFRFMPNSPTFTGAGTPLGQLAACFTENMRVVTDRGLVRIADLRVGDRVLTHRGRFRPVTQTMQRYYEGDLYRIKVKLIGVTLEVTPEHPILTPEGWVEARDLKVGDKVAVGVPRGEVPPPTFDLAQLTYAAEWEVQATETAVRARRPSTYQNSGRQAEWVSRYISLTPELARLCGYYVAEGTVGPDERYVRFTFSEVEAIEVVPFSGIVYNCEVDEDHTYVTEGVVVHNCFVLPISDDMGKEPDGIFMTLRNAALIQQTGGGNGFSFSRLRPKGDIVRSSAGRATGPVGFLRVYDKAFGEIAQGGTRRGANMAVLRVDHPDIFEFIRAKEKEGELTNFNISVALTDEFMRAVEEDREFNLVNPRDGKVWRTVRARELFDEIVRHAHHNGEPGALFIDTANRSNPLPHLYTLEATNPCFVGSTRIATDKGLIPIRELAERGEPFEVVTDNRAPWGGQGDLRPELGTTLRPAVKAWKTRTNVPVMRLRTRKGYTVVATPDHRFLTPDRGYVELRHLRPGDKVLLQSGEGVWSREYKLPNVEILAATMANMALAGDRASGHVIQRRDFVAQYNGVPTEWSFELGLVMGWLVGDGWLSPTSKSPVGLVFRSPEMLARIHGILRGWFGEGHVADRGSHYQVTYGRLPYEFFTSLGVLPVKATEKRVPESIWRAPREAVIGFLQGLFSADGSVQVNEGKRDCTVRLASSSRGLLEDVQLLLLNFGIVSRIYQRREAQDRLLPDGRGGKQMYTTAPQYELVIGKANRDRFAYLIGFADPEKQARLMAYVENLSRGPYRETFVDEVAEIEDAGTADVYDLVEPETHSLIANGLVCHNCGEQWLGPYENCCLGSINLAKHVKEENGRRAVDWDLLRETVETAVHFLDNVVSANKYVPAVPQLREAALRARRIGLGIMGLADMMYDLGIRYGSKEAQEFAAQVMEFIRYHAMRKSIELAKARGPFPAIKGSIYDPDDLKWRPPRWPDWLGGEPKTDWGRPPLDWDAIVEGIKKHGIRNAAVSTIAPTGTIATVAGCEGYGCEPVFALAYIRHFKDGDQDVELEYVSPRFMRAMEEANLDEATRRRVIDEVLRKGTCQHIQELPEHIRHTFVVAQDITAEEHVYMQAALQVFVDNSISKCVVGDTLVLTEHGLVPIAELGECRLPDQFASLDVNVISPYGQERADAFYYGGYRETRKVQLQYGFQLEGTPNHRVHVLTESGEIRFKALEELKPGDIVVLYSGQRRFGPPAQPLPRFSGTFRTSSKPVRFPERMSEDLAFFLGCLTAEGAITVNGVVITHTDRDLLETLQAITKDLFGLESHITKDSRNDVHYLQINSRPLRHWLLTDLGLMPGAANKIIPTCILRASEGEVRAFLRGLFLDAYVTSDGKLFGITLASEKLIRQLQVLLLNVGIVATVRQVSERAWNLTVQGQELARLAEFVGFVEVWKNERIKRRDEGRLHRYRNYSRLLPRFVTQALRDMASSTQVSLRSAFTASGEMNRYQRVRVNLYAGHRLEREDARRVFEHLQRAGGTSPVAEAFFAHDKDGMLYVPVESVSVGFAEVFDIHVPGTHTFIANGLGNHNTINFPEHATVDDVKTAYFLAWRLGCKGITVYVTGTRKEVVLETREVKEKKQREAGQPPAVAQPARASGVPLWQAEAMLRPRPPVLQGKTYRRPTPVGTAWITVNSDENGEPFEVFLNVGKAGSDVAADSEAIGRLISLILRLPSPMSPTDRLREIVHQLSGIGGGRSMGFGPERVRSLPDAIAQVLRQHLEGAANGSETPHQLRLFVNGEEAIAAGTSEAEYGDICPECGQATFIPHEGCRRCTNCGYSEC